MIEGLWRRTSEFLGAAKVVRPLQRRQDSGSGFCLLGVGLFVLVAATYLLPTANEDWKAVAELVVVAAFGGLVGYGELVSRYRDSVSRLLASWPASAYILVNVAASLCALLIVQRTEALNDAHPRWFYEVLLASFGSAAFFRTAVFTVRVGNTDIGVGPSVVLKSLLDAADRMVDRDQAQDRAVDVANIMRDVDFDKARTDLPALCFVLVQNLAAEEQKDAAEQIKMLHQGVKDGTPGGKSILLGAYLLRIVGPDVLEGAVAALGDNIKITNG
ncbi:membrane hypothetical protein [uncultured Gammaproteobacteria bacterium]